jgi:hypothetical protein
MFHNSEPAERVNELANPAEFTSSMPPLGGAPVSVVAEVNSSTVALEQRQMREP